MAHCNRYISREHYLPVSQEKKKTDITFSFGRINCDAMESVLLPMEHFVPGSTIHCCHSIKFSAAHGEMDLMFSCNQRKQNN
jgi:hypothetical protein